MKARADLRRHTWHAVAAPRAWFHKSCSRRSAGIACDAAEKGHRPSRLLCVAAQSSAAAPPWWPPATAAGACAGPEAAARAAAARSCAAARREGVCHPLGRAATRRDARAAGAKAAAGAQRGGDTAASEQRRAHASGGVCADAAMSRARVSSAGGARLPRPAAPVRRTHLIMRTAPSAVHAHAPLSRCSALRRRCPPRSAAMASAAAPSAHPADDDVRKAHIRAAIRTIPDFPKPGACCARHRVTLGCAHGSRSRGAAAMARHCAQASCSRTSPRCCSTRLRIRTAARC